ncbi:hypothetical protein [Leptospira interrogans]|uniref:Uncharacterized protein n=1 Tax=Leptospira interrogans serovar Canicola TaxID=211880 RepID=A0AAP9WBP0_LEPIR|nr:hypothetical protein [Leptospira interrogans]QOI42990.1 hypothetical protein Lepto782_12465 [Leptospira interrogans serovar Canicola]
MENEIELDIIDDETERTVRIRDFMGLSVTISPRVLKIENFNNDSIVGFFETFRIGYMKTDEGHSTGEVFLQDINNLTHIFPFLDIRKIEIVRDELLIANFKERGLGTYQEGANDPDFN